MFHLGSLGRASRMPDSSWTFGMAVAGLADVANLVAKWFTPGGAAALADRPLGPRHPARKVDLQAEVLVSDGEGVFKAKDAEAIYAALGIRKEQIDTRQACQNDIESNFNVMRRMADYHAARATTWGELQAIHDRFFHDHNHQAHFAHRERTDGRFSPAAPVSAFWLASSTAT